MTSETLKIFSESLDENYINREIEKIYKDSGLEKPTILILDSIAACRVAYNVVLTYLYNNNKNLMDEHYFSYSSKIHKLRGCNSKETENIQNINKIIKEHYKNTKDFSSLNIIKTQLLKNVIPKNIEKSLWNITPEQTKEIHRDRIWNNILNSKANFFEYNFDKNIIEVNWIGISFGIFLKNYCILCKNPKQISEDNKGNLHSENGFSIEFYDNSGIYFLKGEKFDRELYTKLIIEKTITAQEILKIKDHGQFIISLEYFGSEKLIKEITGKDIIKMSDIGRMVYIAPDYGYSKIVKEIVGKDILRIKSIEVLRKIVELYDREKFATEVLGKDIMKIRNVETRAILIQFFGYNNLMQELGAKLIDVKDVFNNLDNTPISYELYDFEMEIERRGKTTFRFVKVEDWSTHKKVALGVPVSEETKTCMSAIAWTFGMTEEEYNPQIQT